MGVWIVQHRLLFFPEVVVRVEGLVCSGETRKRENTFGVMNSEVQKKGRGKVSTT